MKSIINIDSESYIDISAMNAKELIEDNPDLIVIDVSPHYDEGHLSGALSHYPSSELESAVPTFDPNALYPVCHADAPSIAGANILFDAGFSDVYRLEGNFAAWESSGYEVER